MTKDLYKKLADYEVRQELIFSILYGLWKVENKNRDLKEVIRKYNEVKIFADL